MTSVEHRTDTAPPHPRPAFAQPRLILYVFLGGALGVAARAGLELALPWSPSGGGVPWAVVIANLAGAFLLGFLLTGLGARGPETPARRDFRLFAGTGVMGGFTTYSELATDTASLFGVDAGVAVIYAAGSVMLGLVFAALGIALAAALFTRGRRAPQAGAS